MTRFLPGDFVRDQQIARLCGFVKAIGTVRYGREHLAVVIIRDCYGHESVLLADQTELIACGICELRGSDCICRERDPIIAQVWYVNEEATV